VMISSSGMIFHDYAVRNLKCAALALPEGDTSKPENIFSSMSDKAVSKVHCDYDYAVVQKREKKLKKLKYGRDLISKTYTKKQLSAISAKAWQRGNHDFTRMTRTACLYMGRTPNLGECDSYWLIVL
jgi:hypothetical protein